MGKNIIYCFTSSLFHSCNTTREIYLMKFVSLLLYSPLFFPHYFTCFPLQIQIFYMVLEYLLQLNLLSSTSRSLLSLFSLVVSKVVFLSLKSGYYKIQDRIFSISLILGRCNMSYAQVLRQGLLKTCLNSQYCSYSRGFGKLIPDG